MAKYVLTRARSPRNDLVGKRFGKLTVIRWAGSSRWECECDCGGSARVFTANLNRENTSSCGCIKNAAASKRATTHGLYNTHAYKTWHSVKRRCFDKNCESYKKYGARGITMHEDWISDPAQFVRDVGQPPTPHHTLDRIDNAKGYFPGNVRWATALEQGCNKTNNRFVTYQGERLTISQLARKVAAECGLRPKQFLRAFEKAIYE
jgi:hypothetical protein